MLSHSEACERNKEAISPVLERYFQDTEQVLEIGSGTAQHAVHFAKKLPHLTWQTSDQAIYLAGIQARLQQTQLNNVLSPFELDVMQPVWLSNQTRKYDAVFSANTLHIMSWTHVKALFANLPNVLSQNGLLIVYGPFKYQQDFTSNSNQQFDSMLRQNDSNSGIRDFEHVNELAEAQGLTLLEDIQMPANNQCLIWRMI